MKSLRAYWQLLLPAAVLAVLIIILAVVSYQGSSSPEPASTGETPAPGSTLPPTRTPWRLPFFRSSETPTPSITPTITPTATPTRTPTRVPTRTRTPTPTPVPLPEMNLLIRTCDTGFDIANRLGEVTNAYITIQNLGELDARDIKVVLSASDEGREHADKSFSFAYLPAGHEISLKLTVDTQSGIDTALQARLTSGEGVNLTASRSNCTRRTTDRTIVRSMGELFVVRAIPTPRP